MANVTIRKQNADKPVAATPAEQTWDPWRTMRSLLAWDPFREMAPFPAFEERAIAFSPAFDYGSFSRSFNLPDGADTEHLQASLDAGVLTITVPKKPEVQPKKIAVKTEGKSPKS